MESTPEKAGPRGWARSGTVPLFMSLRPAEARARTLRPAAPRALSSERRVDTPVPIQEPPVPSRGVSGGGGASDAGE